MAGQKQPHNLKGAYKMTNTEQRYCQSCGMPMGDTDQLYGAEKDGSINQDYCKYCYDKGAFTSNCTMEEMIDFCVPHMTGANPGMDEKEAREMMLGVFPSLKRWKQQ